MNKIKILVISGLMFFSGTYLASAQEVLSVTKVVKARLVRPLILSAGANDLDFGGIVLKTNVGGTVILTPTSGTVATFTDVLADGANLSRIGVLSTQLPTIPLYTLTSEINLAYKITLPSDTDITVGITTTTSVTSDGDDGIAGNDDDVTADVTTVSTEAGEVMTVTAFRYKHNLDTSLLYNVTTSAAQSWQSDDGTDTFALGATLNVGTDQTAGIYTGTYDVTVQYD